MSKPDFPANTPEFANQHDYSGILDTALPPTKPQTSAKADNNLLSTVEFDDPWAEDSPKEIRIDLSKQPLRPKHRAAQPELDLDFGNSNTTNLANSSVGQKPSTEPAQQSSAVKVAARAADEIAPLAEPSRRERHLKHGFPQAASAQPNRVATTAASQPQEQSTPSVAAVNSAIHKPTVDPNAAAITGRDLAMQYCQRGSKALAAKDYAQARSAYKVALEWDSQLALAHSGMAKVCMEVGDYESALLAWDRAISSDPQESDFYYQRALVNKTLKNYFPILADCKWILDRHPDRSDVRWLNAVALVKVENYQIAIHCLDLHVRDFPKDPNGYCYRGICYERLERLDLALADLDRAIALQANHPVFHHARGRTRQKLGDLQGALADFNLTIDRKPQAAVYDDRAEVHRCLGNHREALEDCARAISLWESSTNELNPRTIDSYYRRGLTYQELGDLERALENYSRVIELDNGHLNAYIQRGWTYFRLDDLPKASQDCRMVKTLDPTCFWAYYLRGIVDIRSDMKHSAIQNLSKAIEILPNYVSALYHRGCVYYDLGDKPKAMADFERARSIQERGLERLVDRDETGFYAEGMALYHMGQLEAARTVSILGSLCAKRFSNTTFDKLMQATIERLGVVSGELSDSASNSCSLDRR